MESGVVKEKKYHNLNWTLDIYGRGFKIIVKFEKPKDDSKEMIHIEIKNVNKIYDFGDHTPMTDDDDDDDILQNVAPIYLVSKKILFDPSKEKEKNV